MPARLHRPLDARTAWIGGLLLVFFLMTIAASSRAGASGVSADPPHTITVSGGPKGIKDFPFPKGYEWTLKVDPPVVVGTIKDIRSDQGTSMASSCWSGGLNGGVGTLYIDATCLQQMVSSYTITFTIDDVDHELTVVNPASKAGIFVDFGTASTLPSEGGTYMVRVVNQNEQFVTHYTDTAWVTAFTLRGTRVHLEGTSGAWVPIDIVDGVGTLEIDVKDRVEGDTVILQIEAPRLDTTRSSIDL